MLLRHVCIISHLYICIILQFILRYGALRGMYTYCKFPGPTGICVAMFGSQTASDTTKRLQTFPSCMLWYEMSWGMSNKFEIPDIDAHAQNTSHYLFVQVQVHVCTFHFIGPDRSCIFKKQKMSTFTLVDLKKKDMCI